MQCGGDLYHQRKAVLWQVFSWLLLNLLAPNQSVVSLCCACSVEVGRDVAWERAQLLAIEGNAGETNATRVGIGAR